MSTGKKVAVIMGSDSDLPVVKGAVKKIREFGIDGRRRPPAALRPTRGKTVLA